MDSSLLQKKIEVPELSDKTKGIIRDVMFFAGFIFMVAGSIFNYSMFETSETRYYLQFWGKLILIAKVLIFDRKNKWVWLIGLPIMIFGKTLYSRFGYYEAAALGVTVVSAVGIKFEKIIKTYLYTASAMLAIIMISCFAGLIEDLQYKSDHPFAGFTVRHSFGVVYPTDFACFFFFLFVAYFAAYHKSDKLFVLRAFLPAVAAAVIYCLCITRLDCICMLLITVCLLTLKAIDRKPEISDRQKKPLASKLYERACVLAMPLFAAFFITISFIYTGSSPFLSKLNDILSGRLSLGRLGLERIGITFFGHFVYMVGNGGGTNPVSAEEYFFLDSSYVNILLRYGIVGLLIIIAAFVIIALRYRKDHIMLMCIVLIALDCMIAHHLIDLGFDFMILAVTAEGGIPLKDLFSRRKEEKSSAVSSTESVPSNS